MILLIIICCYVAICSASQNDSQTVVEQVRSRLTQLISNDHLCAPLTWNHVALSREEVELKTKALNEGKLPLSFAVKNKIADVLHGRFSEQKEAINCFTQYAIDHNLYEGSVQRVLAMIAHRYATIEDPIRLPRHGSNYHIHKKDT